MKNKARKVRVTCPYCGVKQDAWMEGGRPEVLLCDFEDVPGCDRYFVAQVAWEPIVATWAMTEASK